jgi:antitoxin component of MazEF toxin-antitoxin module
MPELPIVSVVEPGGVTVPADVLKAIGLEIGDSVDVSIGDGQLILRPSTDARRRQQMDGITRDVFERREDAYRRLA